LLAVKTGIFPAISIMGPETSLDERLCRSLLPSLTLTLVVMASTMRMTRAAIIDLLDRPYVEMARLKGASEARVIVKHILPNAVGPIANAVSFNLAHLVTGVVVVEVVFVYPGLGQLLVDSVAKRDIATVQAACLIFAATYILLNLIADILSLAFNPRLLHPKVDVLMAIPPLMFALLLILLGTGIPTLILVIGLRFCFVLQAIAALSFLGLGIQPPLADWGTMVRETATLITFGDVTPLLPAGAIALLTLAVNFVVDWRLHAATGPRE
jgi:ABC-type dipeptide/oligopeptide/nickel transport system permease subunit